MQKMFFVIGLATVLAWGSETTFAQSAKNAVQLSNVALVNNTTDADWATVLSTTIKTSEQKDLIIGGSFETGLYTQTLVRSKGGNSDTSFAEAQVQVRVLIDGGTAAERIAEPGIVTYDRRYQELMAKFGGVLSCADLNADGIVSFDECTLTEEELNLILDTMAAHHFNFVLDDLGSGEHTVQIQARVITDKGAQLGSASAFGSVGKGSLTVEEVRLVKGVDITR